MVKAKEVTVTKYIGPDFKELSFWNGNRARCHNWRTIVGQAWNGDEWLFQKRETFKGNLNKTIYKLFALSYKELVEQTFKPISQSPKS